MRFHRNIILLIFLLVLATGWSSQAWGEAASGFGLFVGYADYEGDIIFSDPTGTDLYYESDGPAIGLDYQYSIWGKITLGGLISGTMEESDQLDDSVVHGQLLFQVRVWPSENFFLGWHYGLYSLAFTLDPGTKEKVSGNGPGDGWVVGWEFSDGNLRGWFLTLQYDDFEIDGFDESDSIDATAETTGYRVNFGFRWRAD